MNLLLLAGTSQARVLAEHLGADPRVTVTASLAGATRQPLSLGVRTRSGGFGGRCGFEAYLDRHKIDAIIDATHPFAHRITARTAEVAGARHLPYLLVQRAGWHPAAGDIWHLIDREEEAADLIPCDATVFLATGRQTLERFANLAGRHLICRQIDPPDGPFPFDNGAFLVGRPPFSVADETRLFTELSIDWLVVKNAGGKASRTKLDAARALGLPVAMIKRPPAPDCDIVQTPEQALAWLERLL